MPSFAGVRRRSFPKSLVILLIVDIQQDSFILYFKFCGLLGVAAEDGTAAYITFERHDLGGLVLAVDEGAFQRQVDEAGDLLVLPSRDLTGDQGRGADRRQGGQEFGQGASVSSAIGGVHALLGIDFYLTKSLFISLSPQALYLSGHPVGVQQSYLDMMVTSSIGYSF